LLSTSSSRKSAPDARPFAQVIKGLKRGLLALVLMFVLGIVCFVAVKSSLDWAAYKSNPGLARVALLLGADPSLPGKKGFTPLHWAAWRANEQVVELLLQHGANVEAVDGYGYTPLTWASANRTPRTVDLLLRYHADPNTPIRSGKLSGATPLMLAAGAQDVVSARSLVAAGANVNARTADGLTPLGSAAFAGQPGVVEFLIGAGANVESRNKAGMTPLFEAALNGNEEAVVVLLKHGADPSLKDRRGRPLLARVERFHPELMPVFEKYAAKRKR
jgi:ankyrin repeat protein